MYWKDKKEWEKTRAKNRDSKKGIMEFRKINGSLYELLQ